MHDLGALWVESQGLPVPLNGKRMASALSVLLVNLNEKVRSDVLIEAVWGDESSPRASAALDTLLWRLRRVLDPGRSARAASTVLRTEEHGYRLTLPPDAVDSWRFAEAARAITRGRTPVDPESTVELTGSVLALWRGRPYDDVDDTGWLDPHRARLQELHLAVEQARISALLDTGRPEQAVAELVPILADHPYLEQLWHYRIVGLYRAGRVAAALEAYDEVRRLLDRELGMPPGPDLQGLQQQLLRRDPALAGPPPTPPARGQIRIPRHRTTLIGRAEDVTAVDALLRRHRLVSITGAVGSGKTRLAAAVADRIQSRFPDGVCFVDLSDVASAPAVADRVQETLGVDGDTAESALDAVARYAGGRELLIVLDNCEQVAASASALAGAVLADGGTARILVTSRRVLGAHNEVVYRLRPLPTPASGNPTDLHASPAAALFVDRAAARGIDIDLAGPQGADVAQICQALDGLPLGIELAAARAQVFQLHEIARRVAEHPLGLGTRSAGSPRSGEHTLRESIDGSHSLLTDQERAAHRRLSVLPPRFTADAATAACSGDGLPADEVPNALIGLAGHSLLEATRPERPDGPSLFRQLAPIRAHAARHLRAAGEVERTENALLVWILSTVAAGPRVGRSDGGAADRHFDDNRRTITSALEAAIAAGPSDDVIVTLCRLVPYWWLDGKLGPETVRLLSTALTAVGPANSDFARAAVIAAHGSFLAATQQVPLSDGALTDAIDRLRNAPTALAIVAGELLLSIAAACWVGGDMSAAYAAADGVAAYGEQLDDDDLRVLARSMRCALGLMTDPVAAGRAARAVLDECLHVGNSSAVIMCYHTLYMSALAQQNGPEGLHWNAEALRVQQEIGQRNAAPTLEARGSLYMLAGNANDAIRCYGSAHFQCARLGRTWPQIPGTAELLAAARDQLSAEESDDAWASGERLAASNTIGAWA